MSRGRFFVFVVVVWVLATAPWLLATRRSTGVDQVAFSLSFGTVNAVTVVGFMILWGVLRTKLRVPSVGLALSMGYLLLTLSLWISSATWLPRLGEASMALLVLPFPLGAVVFAHPFFWRFGFTALLLTVPVGAMFYWFLGSLFERMVLRPQPRAQNPERT